MKNVRADRAKRLVWLLVAAAALAFAVEGGEYGTSDLLKQRHRRARLVAQIDSLELLVDSLATYKARLRADPSLQERIARERFGMVRGDGEMLYRFAHPPDSADNASRP
ncbi:MAG: FtsB family cell division protein [Gemmatimonadaceae bacterium]